MNLDHDFFQMSKLSVDQRKRSSQKEGKLYSPNCSGNLRSNALQNQIIGGKQIQTILKLLGGTYIPIPPLGFDTPVGEKMKQRQTNVKETDLWETIIRLEAQNKA